MSRGFGVKTLNHETRLYGEFYDDNHQHRVVGDEEQDDISSGINIASKC